MIKKLTKVVGYEYICDLLKKPIEEKDIYLRDGNRVYSKEAIQNLSPFFHDSEKLDNLAKYGEYKNAIQKTPFKVCTENLLYVIPVDDLQQARKKIKDSSSYLVYLILKNDEYLETRYGGKEYIDDGEETYGYWNERCEWMQDCSLPSRHVRVGRATLHKGVLGEVILMHSQYRTNDSITYEQYDILATSVGTLLQKRYMTKPYLVKNHNIIRPQPLSNF